MSHKNISANNGNTIAHIIKIALVFICMCLLYVLMSAYDIIPQKVNAEETHDTQALIADDTSSHTTTNANKVAQTSTKDVQTPASHDKQIEFLSIDLKDANIDKVYVDKSTQKLYLMQGGKAVKSYHIALGDAPKGHKQQEGDERTPEGTYILDYKNENSIAHRSIHVSYPNADDIASAKARGVSPGGAIMIHGQMNGYGHLAEINQQRNWTDGCMAVTDDEMDEIMDAVKVGTPIEIVW